jgi:thiol:disulfide interchange protein
MNMIVMLLCLPFYFTGPEMAIKPSVKVERVASSGYELAKMNTWDQKAKDWAKGKKVFVRFTGDACLTCKFQWASFNKDKLYHLSKANDIYLFEANLSDKGDNSFTLKEISDLNLGGVPAYIYIEETGKVKVLEPGIWDANNILTQFPKGALFE